MNKRKLPLVLVLLVTIVATLGTTGVLALHFVLSSTTDMRHFLTIASWVNGIGMFLIFSYLFWIFLSDYELLFARKGTEYRLAIKYILIGIALGCSAFLDPPFAVSQAIILLGAVYIFVFGVSHIYLGKCHTALVKHINGEDRIIDVVDEGKKEKKQKKGIELIEGLGFWALSIVLFKIMESLYPMLWPIQDVGSALLVAFIALFFLEGLRRIIHAACMK